MIKSKLKSSIYAEFTGSCYQYLMHYPTVQEIDIHSLHFKSGELTNELNGIMN